MSLCRGLNTAGVGTLQETVLRRLWLLWMEQSIVSNTANSRQQLHLAVTLVICRLRFLHIAQIKIRKVTEVKWEYHTYFLTVLTDTHIIIAPIF